MSFVQPDIEIDPDELAESAYRVLQDQFPLWKPSEGEYEAFLIEALSQIVSVLTTVAQDVPVAIFRYFGSLVGILPDDATYASVDATLTAIDTAGYTVPSGTPVGINATGDSAVTFVTVGDAIFDPGNDTTIVTLQALQPGVAASDIGTLGITRADSLAFLEDVELIGTTIGGSDAESDADFINRLTVQLRLMAPRPLEPEEFAQFAMTIAGVYRCLALNTYDPATRTYTNEGHLSLVPVDLNGDAVNSTLRDAITDLLETNRVLGVTLHILSPTYTRLVIAYTGVTYSGYDAGTVRSAADAAILTYVNRATWGTRQDPRSWVDDRLVLRIQDLSTILNNVVGFDYWTALTINAGTRDVTLTGPAALPASTSTVTGTMTEPT